MYKLIFFSISLFAILASANPFETFVGNFQLDGKVNTVMENSIYCNQYAINELKTFEIKQDRSKRYFQAELNSILNNSPMVSTVSFIEYLYSSPQNNLINKAVISGDNSSANYTITNSSDYALETLNWTFIKTNSGLHVNLSYKYIRADGSSRASCKYDFNANKL